MSQGSGNGTPPAARKTPAMEQYLAIKAKHPDSILFFHIGDFYETFGSDAELVSRELDIVLTSRSKGAEGSRIPLAGVPYHAAEGYIARLVAKGYRVAVCDQAEDARSAKGIVRREVVRVITPGTVIDPGMAPGPQARYLMSVACPDEKKICGLAFLDISTGEFFSSSCQADGAAFRSEIARHRPSECITDPAFPRELLAVIEEEGIPVTTWKKEAFDPEAGAEVLQEHFGTGSLAGFGQLGPETAGAAGAALRYAKETQKCGLAHIGMLSDRRASGSLVLDAVTLRNLEVLESISGRTRSGSLIGALDMTETAMGSRLLRSWITSPLTDPAGINDRLEAVAYYLENTGVRRELRETLHRLGDIARIAGRISYGNAGPRDLGTLSNALALVPGVRDLHTHAPSLVMGSAGALRDCPAARDLIRRAIADDPPAVVRNGGVIRPGYDGKLDAERARSGSGKGWIAALQQTEREKTGIRSLKVGYTSVFGYYIEVSRANLHLVPPHYERRQTTTGGERYTIPELREKEALVTAADERVLSLEKEIYARILEELRGTVQDLLETAEGIGTLDLLSSLAEVAERHGYTRPVVDTGSAHILRDARHPVVERHMDGAFVPNDLSLSASGEQVLIITGANMAGKSTYMRSVALITLMAQMGSFVPASYAKVGVVDQIFTRVGAFDDLARGQSTFMVEMLELAHILTHVTSRSLVILDEIGRGTSTLDGFCIAQAVLEYLHGRGTEGPRTLFATHFHELVGIEGEWKRARNYHFAVKDTGSSVIFLRKLIPGATDRSYGIHVAERAGVPAKVIERAYALLEEIQKREYRPGVAKRYTQLLLIDSPGPAPPDPVIRELSRIDPESMTPLQALEKLYELRSTCRERRG
ncbi:MAG: DNA mismatch repair protein MutS [Methanoregulaceae archaeon]|nr:DNA mismatch repair protein MutS [Methanoregulaceae archaeon]